MELKMNDPGNFHNFNCRDRKILQLSRLLLLEVYLKLRSNFQLNTTSCITVGKVQEWLNCMAMVIH